eukprot:scpid107460/ scgid19102/ Sushi, von Willebrand factor type A, EGF and pentraxin domain-containing protein 1; CCP module-containing protein 22; Polydom; Selectin-like osteoblast-derived protein; Serologically defined breast cancer antigen NY-BR-38
MFSVGSVLNIQCLPGTELNGFSTFNCERNGKWSPNVPPICDRLFCPEPENTFANGQISGSYEVNSSITYTCDDGYALVGDAARRCMVDQTWGGTEPNCTKPDCPSSDWMRFGDNCSYFGTDSLVFS